MTDSQPRTDAADGPLRVLLVDNSAVIRGFLSRFIEAAPDMKITASASNGEQALSMMERQEFDVVVLDIEMPVMDGLTALPLILQRDPALGVIMASTLTRENAAVTLKCLQIGATECLAKPTSSEMTGATTFQDMLVQKVRAVGMATRKRRGRTAPPAAEVAPHVGRETPPAMPKAAISLRPDKPFLPEVIAIGSSTGGPQALLQFFGEIKTALRQPVFITQHMPPTFTAILADSIAKQSGAVCREAVDGEPVMEGRIYVAPGNYHMVVQGKGAAAKIQLTQTPPENFCRPSVDPMLRSLVQAYGSRILGVILTGMGADGLAGCRMVVDAGGTVYAQDEATSVVWGMPGAVATAGICSQVLPLARLAPAVREAAAGRRVPA